MRILNILTTFTLSIATLLLFTWAVATPTAAAPTTHHVAPSASCAGAMPCYATLQAAIDAAAPGDELRVAQGVYTSTTAFEYDLGGWTQIITQVMFIDKSLTVRGGYTITDWTAAHPISYPTVIDPQRRGRGGVISKLDRDTPITVTLEGLSITHGYAEVSGGGLYVEGASVVISDCHIHHNHGGSLAGGVYLNSDSVTLAQNRIAHNTGEYGVVVEMGVPVRLSENYIVNNENGLLLWGNRVSMTNTVIAGNAGTGLTIIGSEVHAWHTTLADNGAVGVAAQNSGQGPASVTLTNTILAGPGVGVRALGHVEDPTTVQLMATLWDNFTDTHIVDAGGQITQSRDFSGNPAFVSDGDYHLRATSPARNRGRASNVQRDIDGELRDPLPDLGADEYFDPGSIRQVYLPLVVGQNAH